MIHVIWSNPKFSPKNHLLIPILDPPLLRREHLEETGNTLSVAYPSLLGAARTPSAFSCPELLVGRDGPEVRVTSPWLCDRTSPCVKLDAGDGSIANL